MLAIAHYSDVRLASQPNAGSGAIRPQVSSQNSSASGEVLEKNAPTRLELATSALTVAH